MSQVAALRVVPPHQPMHHTLRRDFRRVCLQVGVPRPVTPRDALHRRLADGRGRRSAVADSLGHKHLEVIAERYGHRTDGVTEFPRRGARQP